MKRTAAVIAAPLILMLGLTACDDNKGTITPAQSETVATEEATDDTETATEEEAEANDTADEVTSSNPTFGDTYTWPDGLAVTISAPEVVEPSEAAAGTVDGQENLSFTITVTNGTGEDIESSMIMLTVVSGGHEASEIFDTDWEYPTSTILPGKDLTWKVAYSVADPSDLQITVDNVIDFGSPKVHFTS